MHLRVALAFAIVLATPAAAASEAESETVALSYHVPRGCPDENAFVSAVGQRTHRAKFVDHAPDARRFVVDIRGAGESYAGSLVVEEGKHRARRELTSSRCEEIVEAFVFFTAITLDPGASLASSPPSSAAVPPPPAPPQEQERMPERPPVVPRSEPAAPPPSPTLALAPARPSWHLAVGSGAYVASGIAATPMVAVHPVVDLASSAAGLSPSVSLGVVWANSTSQEVYPGKLTLGLRAVALTGCGYRVPLDGDKRAGLRLCAVVEAGMLELRPFGFPQPTSPERPWFAAGPLLRFDWPILADRLVFRADAGVAFPLEREHVHVVSEPSAAGPAAAGPPTEVVQHLGARIALGVLVQVF